MLPDLIAAGHITGFVRRDFYDAPAGSQPEMMSGLLVRKPHRVVAAPVDLVVMLPVLMLPMLIVRGLLSCGEHGERRKDYDQSSSVFHITFLPSVFVSTSAL
jgi:hypothetical protein